MRLTDDTIEEFRTLWEQEFGEVITKEFAQIRGQEIVMLYEKLYLSGAWLKKDGGDGEEAPPRTSS